jgi:hypothetical protein
MPFDAFSFCYPSEISPLIYEKNRSLLPDTNKQGFAVVGLNNNYWLKNSRGSWGEMDYSCVGYYPIRANNAGPWPGQAPFARSSLVSSTTLASEDTSWEICEYSEEHGLESTRNRDTGQLDTTEEERTSSRAITSKMINSVAGEVSTWLPGATPVYALGPRHVICGGLENVTVSLRHGWITGVWKKCYFITRSGEVISRRFKSTAADIDRVDATDTGFAFPGSYFMEMEDGEEDFPSGISFIRTYDRTLSNLTMPSGEYGTFGAVRLSQHMLQTPALVSHIFSDTNAAAMVDCASYYNLNKLSPSNYQNQKVGSWDSMLISGMSGNSLMFKGDNNEAVIVPTIGAVSRCRL